MMEKNIEDYLHLYLGCEVEVDQTSANMGYKKGVLMGVVRGLYQTFYHVRHDEWNDQAYHKFPIKPILRPLSDMTEEEAAETHTWIQWTERHSANGQTSGYDADQIRRMLAKGFDLFGLIESGLAIDKTTLTIKPSKHE